MRTRRGRVVPAAVLVLALMAGTPARAADDYTVDRKALVIGEPLALRISRDVDAGGPSLQALDLSPLARDFEIHGRSVGGDGRREDLTLTLYPLRTGRIELPRLGMRGTAPVIDVAESSDTSSKVHLRVAVEPGPLRVRQPAALTVEACDLDRLQWQRPELPAVEGLILRPLGETELTVEREGTRCTAHRWHWLVLPTASGGGRIELPMLQATRLGKRLRFPAPPFEWQALPIPGWLPAEAAVGRPEVTLEEAPAQANVGQPVSWRLRASGYDQRALQSLLALQLAGHADSSIHAPRVDEVLPASVPPQHLITLIVRPSRRGELRLPELDFPWLDPASGLLEHVRLAAPRIDVVDPARQRALRVAAAVIAMVLAALAVVAAHRVLSWRLRRRRLLRAMERSESVDGLCRLLLSFSLRGESAPAPTLRQWQRRMESEATSSGLTQLVEALERVRYGRRVNSNAPTGEASGVADELIGMARAWAHTIRIAGRQPRGTPLLSPMPR